MVAVPDITVVAATAATIMNTTMTMIIPVCDGIITTIAEPITTTVTGGTPEAAMTAGIGTLTVPGIPATHGIPAVPTGAQTGKKGEEQ